MDAAPFPDALSFAADCTFCPGNPRIGGARNPRYQGVFVFDNDRPPVGLGAPADLRPAPGCYRRRPAEGVARVMCFSPRHDRSLAQCTVAEVEAVLACWQQQRRELAGVPGIEHVLMFENRGAAVGVSNPHPHGQIYATNFVFPTIAAEVAACAEHAQATGRSLWEDIVATEVGDGARVVASDGDVVAFVPWFARWAYEVYVGPRRAVPSIDRLTDRERASFAVVLREVLTRCDNLWRQPFPYVMVLHDAPTGGGDPRGFGCHVELHPPLRKPGLRKFLAGPEVGGGGFLADTDPDATAAELRAVSPVHYLQEGAPRT